MKKLWAFIFIIIFVFQLSFVVSAANHVSTIDVNVSINKDGSAVIKQIWTGTFNEGTENYIPFRTNGYLEITDFTVSDENGSYTTLESWDIDASFKEKARKCGLAVTDEGYEICWGISEYGSNTYTVQYTVHNIVGAYSDSDGFNFRFINDEMNITPTDASITIAMADGTRITDDNCNIWAFGYDGQIQFKDGLIYAYTESPLDSSNHMTIMVELNKGVTSPLRKSDQSFETVKDRAFKGSDYDDDDDVLGVFIFIATLFVLIIIISIVSVAVRKAKLRQMMKKAPYFRDKPNDGNLNATYILGMSFVDCKESSIIGARILNLINAGCLEPENDTRVGFMGTVKKDTNLRLVNKPQNDADEYDQELYSILAGAAGSDGVLQKKELENYCTMHPELLRSLIDKCKADGQTALIQKKCFKRGAYNRLTYLTETGKQELNEVMGLKKYLLDFSLIAEREVNETYVWQDYMVYALLMGIAEKVAQQLRRVYPQEIPQIEVYEQNTMYAYYYSSFMYTAMRNKERAIEAARNAGSGGSASFGGGGGFSGGGSGGGSR